MPGYLNPTDMPAIKAVAMGGGTGLSTLLHGLKHYVTAPTAEAPPHGLAARLRTVGHRDRQR